MGTNLAAGCKKESIIGLKIAKPPGLCLAAHRAVNNWDIKYPPEGQAGTSTPAAAAAAKLAGWKEKGLPGEC